MSYIGTQPVPQSLESRQEFTATASQTTFATNGYTVGYVDVYLNGVKLSTSDFTATNGSDVVLGSGATAGDILAVVMKNDHSDLVALPITDSQGNNVLSESSGTVTLTADEANVGSNALVVDSNGNVGVGTSSPQGFFDVSVIPSGARRFEVSYENSVVSLAATSGATGTNRIENLGIYGDSIRFYIDNTTSEAMRIDSSGNVLVGIPSADGSQLYVKQTTNDWVLGLDSTISGTQYFQAFRYNGVAIGTIIGSNTSTSFNTSSDYRLKENITEITDGITRIKQLNPSRFNFIADPDKIVDGFIAHEVQDIVPEAISGEKDAVDLDGNPKYQGVDYGRITPLLTAALKEAIAKIEMLEARIAVLEAK
jgi:hypothetical protein